MRMISVCSSIDGTGVSISFMFNRDNFPRVADLIRFCISFCAFGEDKKELKYRGKVRLLIILAAFSVKLAPLSDSGITPAFPMLPTIEI